MVIILSMKDLWCHVVFRSLFGQIRRRLVTDPRNPEISDFKILIIIHKNVIGFDIPVNDPFALEKLQRLYKLPAHS